MSAQFEEEMKKLDLKSLVIGSIIGALGFLVALSWRDLIQHVIKSFLPESNDLAYQFFTTVIITFMALFLGWALLKFSEKSIFDVFKTKRSYKVSGKMKVKLYK